MNLMVVQRVLGLLLMLFSLTMLPPVLVGFMFDERAWLPFVESFVVTLAAGVLVWLPVRWVERELRVRDGFLVVASFWVVLGAFGALPLVLAVTPVMSVTDAVFESISGLTTTGATVLTGLDMLPKSILYYRAQLHWFGGMGVVVLAVAILPMLGIGGMQLYRAETPGPIKDTKLTPRITQTAKALWYIYLTITVLCAISYLLAGMSAFDAVCHAFATVATGGFATHDLSIGYFNSTAIDLVAIFFMFISGVNFSLHFFAWRYNQPGHYLKDPEFRAYGFLAVATSAIIVAALWLSGHHDDLGRAALDGVFHVVSMMTTTGFTTANFSDWPGALPVMLIFVTFFGGSGGSTAGGMKVIRWLLVYKQGAREIVRLVHPSAAIPVKIGGHAVSPRVIDAVWGFFAVYLIAFGVLLLAMMAAGLDQVTAFSAVATTMNNTGPGLGDVAVVFASVPDTGKWIGVIAMLLGRLEIFTLLVLVTPTFWRP
ncbi:MAG TPA: TrkH family potassium uptake protein [Woeseiaceae bacterium]|nr:TrkH family potassium uptake protein [Woeseiaceae bacterium]